MVAFAFHFRWQHVQLDAISPRSLVEFRGYQCLVFYRLDADAKWANVEREICPIDGNADSRPALRVPRTP